jgi:hypothetical protein
MTRTLRLLLDATVIGLGLWGGIRLLVAGAIAAFPGTF